MLNKLFNKNQVITTIVQFDQHVELGANNDSNFINKTMESTSVHDDSLGPCSDWTEGVVGLGLIVGQIIDFPEDILLVGVTIHTFG